ncbi:MAG: nucleoside deaminase [Defluviitaleaceae bacterium]|nr:nucleoside deaminase [Defluviitaleaceae bacterium]
MDYEFFMEQAYLQALQAKEINEVPIGCVIVHENQIIATGFNERNTKKNVLCHGEITAINQACNYLGDWRLEGCTMFVTLEPCPMCTGAIIQARMERLVYGANSPKAGSVFSVASMLDNPLYNHKVEVVQGVLGSKCGQLVKDFFLSLRKN